MNKYYDEDPLMFQIGMILLELLQIAFIGYAIAKIRDENKYQVSRFDEMLENVRDKRLRYVKQQPTTTTTTTDDEEVMYIRKPPVEKPVKVVKERVKSDKKSQGSVEESDRKDSKLKKKTKKSNSNAKSDKKKKKSHPKMKKSNENSSDASDRKGKSSKKTSKAKHDQGKPHKK